MTSNSETIDMIKEMLDALENGKSITYKLITENGKTKNIKIDDPNKKIKTIKEFIDELEY